MCCNLKYKLLNCNYSFRAFHYLKCILYTSHNIFYNVFYHFRVYYEYISLFIFFVVVALTLDGLSSRQISSLRNSIHSRGTVLEVLPSHLINLLSIQTFIVYREICTVFEAVQFYEFVVEMSHLTQEQVVSGHQHITDEILQIRLLCSS